MPNEVVFSNPNTGGYILLEGAVLEKMARFRQHTFDSKEAGGLLLGYRRGPHLEISDLTLPYSMDVRRRNFFFRCDSSHKKYATLVWAGSAKTTDYLGEWHTHPESAPSPSKLDRSEWKKVNKYSKSTMIFLIIGLDDIWMGVSNGGDVVCSKRIIA